MTKTTVDALHSLTPNAEWALMSDGSLVWHDKKQTKPTDKELADEVVRLQAEYDSQEYARKRKAEDDQLNQFEMQFDDKRDGTTTWVDAINAIKAKYPKP